jgi:hypothetical protein
MPCATFKAWMAPITLAQRISPSCTPKKRSTVHQEGQLLGEQQLGICTEAAPRTAPGG